MMHLSGDAAHWISWYEAWFPRDNWEHFSDPNPTFWASDTLDLTASLLHIRQGGFVKEGFRMV